MGLIKRGVVHYCYHAPFPKSPMNLYSGQTSNKGVFILILCAALTWIGFGPVQLGGAVSYIVINGNSMEPAIQYGDLVVARKSDQYQLDQSVIYKHPQLGYVFHRIVDREQNRFILKGDNNTWLDSYHPAQDDILGRYWFHISGAGKAIIALRQPLYFGTFVIITFSLIGGLIFTPDQSPTGRKKGKRRSMSKEKPTTFSSDFRLDLLVIMALIAAAALVFCLIAFSKKTHIPVNDDLIYRHTAKLAYTTSDASDIYDRSGIETGDPVYPTLNCIVDFDFDYKFISPRLAAEDKDQFEGLINVVAEVRDNNGWHRTFLLVPDYQFSGTEIKAQPSINICRALDLIEHKEYKTGLEVQTYTFSILPHINIAGELEGLAVDDEYLPEFVFELNESVLRIPAKSDGFNVETEGKIPHEDEMVNFMNIFGRQIEVLTIRRVSLIVLGMCLLAAVYPTWSLIREWQSSVQSRIEFQHRPLLIDLKSGVIDRKDYTVITLETMGDLRKLADRYGAMIMHESEGIIHRYLVVDEGYIYKFEIDEEDQINSNGENDEDLG